MNSNEAKPAEKKTTAQELIAVKSKPSSSNSRQARATR